MSDSSRVLKPTNDDLPTELTDLATVVSQMPAEVRDKLDEHGIELKPPKGGFRSVDLLDDDDDDF